MQYQIRIAGKLFAGDDPKVLLKRAVEAKRAKSCKVVGGPRFGQPPKRSVSGAAA